MAALTANLGSTHGAKFGTIQTYKVAAGEHIYRYATVVIKQSDGYLYAAVEDTSDAEKQIVVGFSLEEGDNSSGINGAKSVRARLEGRLRRNFDGSATQADIGSLACIKDDQTVQRYGALTGKIVLGRISEVIDGNTVFVNLLDKPLRLATSAND